MTQDRRSFEYPSKALGDRAMSHLREAVEGYRRAPDQDGHTIERLERAVEAVALAVRREGVANSNARSASARFAPKDQATLDRANAAAQHRKADQARDKSHDRDDLEGR